MDQADVETDHDGVKEEDDEQAEERHGADQRPSVDGGHDEQNGSALGEKGNRL